ncbi:S26 family signal peptidase [Halonotius sp. F2-221B]|uniref:S26 family signal peptidase n=1 Tax=Halonotius sp. F2-221B TaxID=2731620 RepID=UPI00398B216D
MSDGDRQPAVESEPDEGSWFQRLRGADDGPLLFLRELLLSLSIVAAIGLVLFAATGVWPPMVAVESNSMDPNINKYDLVVVSEPGRFAPGEANDQGLVMADTSDTSYESFNQPGSVIVYDYPGRVGSPIIHRVRFRVEAGENWYDRTSPDAVDAESCAELTNCPAPHAGYITKGDNNQRYDQANGVAPVVKSEWVNGVARFRIPYLGRLRLALLGTGYSGGMSGTVSPGSGIVTSGGMVRSVAG